MRRDARGRWAGPPLLAAAAVYLLTLGVLRERLPAVPNVMWTAALVALLAAGGACAGLARPLSRTRLERQRLTGRAAVLGGLLSIAVGILSVRAAAESWTDGARAAGALVLCIGLAMVPFGITVLRRAKHAANLRAAAPAAALPAARVHGASSRTEALPPSVP
jgi:hypothetical protein